MLPAEYVESPATPRIFNDGASQVRGAGAEPRSRCAAQEPRGALETRPPLSRSARHCALLVHGAAPAPAFVSSCRAAAVPSATPTVKTQAREAEVVRAVRLPTFPPTLSGGPRRGCPVRRAPRPAKGGPIWPSTPPTGPPPPPPMARTTPGHRRDHRSSDRIGPR